MPQSLRQLKRRIRSVENTKKITKAMEMVAASKLKKYQDLLGQTRIYAAELDRILKRLITATTSYTHPFFEKREVSKNFAIFVTSDSGLCGSYNSNLFQTIEKFAVSHREPNYFFTLGKQGNAYLKRKRFNLSGELAIPRPSEISNVVQAIIERAKKAFLEKEADRVFLIYTDFVSMASYKPVAVQLLPLEGLEVGEKDNAQTNDYIFEPSAEEILNELIPHFLELKVGQAVKGALVSEQISRMMAMRQATDNAIEMIDSLTLQRNKARQASITKELIEIVSGSKALQK